LILSWECCGNQDQFNGVKELMHHWTEFMFEFAGANAWATRTLSNVWGLASSLKLWYHWWISKNLNPQSQVVAREKRKETTKTISGCFCFSILKITADIIDQWRIKCGIIAHGAWPKLLSSQCKSFVHALLLAVEVDKPNPKLTIWSDWIAWNSQGFSKRTRTERSSVQQIGNLEDSSQSRNGEGLDFPSLPCFLCWKQTSRYHVLG